MIQAQKIGGGSCVEEIGMDGMTNKSPNWSTNRGVGEWKHSDSKVTTIISDNKSGWCSPPNRNRANDQWLNEEPIFMMIREVDELPD